MNREPKAMLLAMPPARRLGTEEGWWGMGLRLKRVWVACCLLAGILLVALPSTAQLEVLGTQMSLSGDIGSAYNGSMNQGSSGHTLGFTGDANLQGSYYNPNFLNFTVQPFYDRTQSNSVFGSLTNTSGVNSNVNLFNGSHFPGSISYNKVLNSAGEFGVPGSSVGLATNGSNQGFAVSWSALLPDLPTLTATYEIGSGSSSIYGLQDESKQHNRDFMLQSTYRVAGFRLTGRYDHRNIDDTFSQPLSGVPEAVTTDTATNNYQVNAQHAFPLQGSFSLSASRTGYSYDYHDSTSTSNSGASNSLNGDLSFRPLSKVSLNFIANYSDSLLGSLPEQVVNSGGGSSLGKFRSVLVGSDVNYQVLNNLGLHATVSHVDQEFLGQSYGATQFAAGANYTMDRNLLKGLSFSFGAVDSATKEGNSGLGFVGNLNYNRKLAGWNVDANFSYSQNVSTLVLIYTTSSYGWVSNVRHRVGNRSYFAAGYGGSHSGLAEVAGNSSSAQRVSSSFTYGRYSVHGFYSTSNGTAEFTPTGLVAVPTNLPPSAFPPGSLILFNSKSYGFSGSATPVRRLSISLAYAQSSGDTVDPLASTLTKNNLINGIMQYRLRKIYVNGGYTHLRQSVGVPGSSPISVTTYYIGISRWFNFF